MLQPREDTLFNNIRVPWHVAFLQKIANDEPPQEEPTDEARKRWAHNLVLAARIVLYDRASLESLLNAERGKLWNLCEAVGRLTRPDGNRAGSKLYPAPITAIGELSEFALEVDAFRAKAAAFDRLQASVAENEEGAPASESITRETPIIAPSALAILGVRLVDSLFNAFGSFTPGTSFPDDNWRIWPTVGAIVDQADETLLRKRGIGGVSVAKIGQLRRMVDRV